MTSLYTYTKLSVDDPTCGSRLSENQALLVVALLCRLNNIVAILTLEAAAIKS